MAFSSFSEFFFMPSIDLWRVPRSTPGVCPKDEVINPHLVTSNNTFDECRVISYVGKHLSYELYSKFFLQKIQVFRYESGGDALHTQNINNNVLSRSIRDF